MSHHELSCYHHSEGSVIKFQCFSKIVPSAEWERRLWPYGHNSPLCKMGEDTMAIRSQESPLQNRERSLWPYDHISPLCRMGEGGYDHMVTIVPSAEWERRLWFFWAWIWPFVQLEFWLKGTEMANRYHFWPKTRQLTGCWSIQSWQYTSLVYSDKRGIHI